MLVDCFFDASGGVRRPIFFFLVIKDVFFLKLFYGSILQVWSYTTKNFLPSSQPEFFHLQNRTLSSKNVDM